MDRWFTTSFRRNLVDMHIDDWDPHFLSRFSPEEYCERLKQAHIQTSMIYLQSHVGHCYFPTQSGHMHASFVGREDAMRRLVDLCHQNGMSVVGYYSLIYNTYEEDRHPEWRIIMDSDGNSPRRKGGRYGLLCPNNPGYRAFVLRQIEEIADYFQLEGMFYDMLFWPEICRCRSCRDRWKAESGLNELPMEPDWHSETWLRFVEARRQWMGEFACWVTEETKRRMPGITVEHNYASAVAMDWKSGSSELVNDACDYTGGDLYGDLYNHSFTAKYYRNVTKNQPFEYMTCRCDSNLLQHTVTKTEEKLSVEVMLTAAHHGASFVIDAIDPVGTLDRRVYERIGRVFERQIPYERYFTGEMVEEVGVYYATTGQYNPDGQSYTNKSCAVSAVRTLIEYNLPVGVLSNGCVEKISACRVLCLPAITGLAPSVRERLVEYVRTGGTLYFSGAGEPALLSALLDGRVEKISASDRVYLAPKPAYEELLGGFSEKYPLPFSYQLPMVRFRSEEGVIARLALPYTLPQERRFASIHSNPPGILTDYPAVVVRSFGKGQVIWSAAPLEEDGRTVYKRIFLNLLLSSFPERERFLLSDAPRQVELVSFRDGEAVRISAVDLLYSDERLSVGGFEVSVRLKERKEGYRLRQLPESGELPCMWRDGRLCFHIPALSMFAMYEIVPA